MDIDKINELYYRHLELLKENAEESAHPYPGPLTDLGRGYYWAAERDGDRDDQWYNFFLLKSANAENNLYKTLSSFIKVRDYDLNLISGESDRIKAWLKKNKGIDLGEERAGAREEQNEEEGEDYVAGMGMPDFIERILIIAGNSSMNPQEKLRRILKMSFSAQRGLQGDENEEHIHPSSSSDEPSFDLAGDVFRRPAGWNKGFPQGIEIAAGGKEEPFLKDGKWHIRVFDKKNHQHFIYSYKDDVFVPDI